MKQWSRIRRSPKAPGFDPLALYRVRLWTCSDPCLCSQPRVETWRPYDLAHGHGSWVPVWSGTFYESPTRSQRAEQLLELRAAARGYGLKLWHFPL